MSDLKERINAFSVVSTTDPRITVLTDVLDVQKQKSKEKEKTLVYAFGGRPGVGKTTLSTDVLLLLQNVYGVTPSLLHWDSIEDSLRSEGLLTTRSGDPYTGKELRAVQNYILSSLETLLSFPRENPILVEFPLGVSYLTHAKKRKEYRPYGAPIVDALISGEAPFTPDFRERITIVAIGIIEGPWLQILSYYRHAIITARSLEHANEINAIFGFPRFQSTQEWLALEGGTRFQIGAANKSTNKVVQSLLKENDFNQLFSTLPSFTKEEMEDMMQVSLLTGKTQDVMLAEGLLAKMHVQIISEELRIADLQKSKKKGQPLLSYDQGVIVRNNPKWTLGDPHEVSRLIALIDDEERNKRNETQSTHSRGKSHHRRQRD